MATRSTGQQTVEEHLEAALATASDSSTKYHIRESLQKLQAREE